MNHETGRSRTAAVIRHVPHEDLGLIEAALAGAGIGYRYYGPDELAAIPAGYDFLIILGGPWSLYDNYPWLKSETAFVRAAIDAGIPVLGICLGAQLIAASLGADVLPCGAREIGWYGIELTPEGVQDALMGRLHPEETVFQWHGDTFELPAGAVHLAASPLCRNQAFRYGDKVYALQFHLEVTAAMVAEWLAVPGNREEVRSLHGEDGGDAIRSGSTRHAERLAAAGGRVFEEFMKL